MALRAPKIYVKNYIFQYAFLFWQAYKALNQHKSFGIALIF
jgi:hypothetical protein